ncbi:MAG: hypothetical protein WAW07_06925 [Bacteroidales bacterium]
MLRKIIYLIILLLVFAAGGSCSRYHQSAYHGANRVRAKPHKEWKQPKPRYKRLSDEVVTHGRRPPNECNPERVEENKKG